VHKFYERQYMTLDDELHVIDETIAELEGRRTELICRITNRVNDRGSSKVLEFPNRIRVSESPIESADDWPGTVKAEITRPLVARLALMRSTSCPSCSSKIFYALQAPGHYLHSQPLLAGVAATNDCLPVLNCLSLSIFICSSPICCSRL
jgi:hypothetical protein